MKPTIVAGPGGLAGPSFGVPARWSLRIACLEPTSQALKVAIGFDETLEFLETQAPFTFDFIAHNFTALISATGTLDAAVWSDVYGSFQRICGFSGSRKGRLSFQPWGPNYSYAGSGF